jgi:hypothetical protein
MRAILSALTMDVFGSVELTLLPTSRFGRTERRVTRVKTLDGGYAVNDFGHAPSDRDIRLLWTANRTTDELVTRLVQLYAQLHLASDQGFYRCAPQALETRDNKTTLDLLVLSKIAT